MTAKQLINEIKIALTINAIIRTILKTIMLFLMIILLYNTLNIPKIFGASPLIYLGVMIYLELKKDKIKQFEEKIPKLKEKLRTAIDNFDVENQIAKELKKGVIKELKEVKISKFIDQRKMFIDFLVIVSLAIIITVMMPYKLENKFFDFRASEIQQSPAYKNFFGSLSSKDSTKEKESSDDKGDKAGRNKFTTIFGNRTVINTGEEIAVIDIENSQNNKENNKEKSETENVFISSEVYVQESNEEKKRLIEKFYEKLS